MTKIAALYARVSTPNQEKEATIESQVAAIEGFGQTQGYELPKELYFLDQSVSGTQLDRPALNRLRDMAAERAYSVVLCLSPDRLARRYAHQWVLLEEFHRAEVQVIFVNQPALANDPQSQFFLGMQGVFAEYERALIIERLRRGRLYRVKQGQRLSPSAPFGYHYILVGQPNGGKWEVDPDKAEIVRRIYLWYTQEDDLTITALADRLNRSENRMPPPGKHWHYSLVRSILTQPAYTGRGYFNRTRNCHEVIGRAKQCGRGQLRYPKSKPRPRSEWVEVTVPAILSEEIWHQAQEKLAMKQKFAKRNNKRHFYLLRSLLVCDLCGRTLSGRTYKEQATYFCGNHGKHATPGTTAHTRTIKGQIIEPLIWDAVVKLLRNPNLMMDAWASQGKPQEITPEEADQLEARLRTLQRQWVRILDAFQDGLVPKEELALRKKRLEQEKHTVEQRLHQIRHQVHQTHEQSQVLKDFTAFCQQIDASLNDPSPETKQKVIRLLIDHVVVGENEIVIKHIVPTDDDCRLLSERIFANHREKCLKTLHYRTLF